MVELHQAREEARFTEISHVRVSQSPWGKCNDEMTLDVFIFSDDDTDPPLRGALGTNEAILLAIELLKKTPCAGLTKKLKEYVELRRPWNQNYRGGYNEGVTNGEDEGTDAERT